MVNGYQGQAKPEDGIGDFNPQVFLIRQLLKECNTTTLVKVVKCTNAGELAAVGFVDIQPLVNLIDGAGIAKTDAVIYNCVYFRLQGGANAVILDPQVGDIGICCFASEDISNVKGTKAQANPASFRRFSMSDGIYLGGVLNGVPNQYIEFSSAGIKVNSPNLINLVAPVVQINAITSVTITTPEFIVDGFTTLNGGVTQGTSFGGGSSAIHVIGPLTVDNDTTAAGTSLHTHVHSDPQGEYTGVPI